MANLAIFKSNKEKKIMRLEFTTKEKVRLDKAILERTNDFTRGQIQKIIQAGFVSVNGKTEIDPGRFILAGSTIDSSLVIPETKMQEIDISIKVLYHDNGLIIIDKPAGISVHPGSGTKEVTLTEKLLQKFPQLEGVGEKHRAGIVHRLDKETSGCLLIAETQEIYEHLRKAFEMRTVYKEYIALVHGHMERRHQTIETDIGASKTDFRKQTASEAKDPKPAKTEIIVDKWLYYPRGGNTETTRQKVDEYTLIKLILHTGRTHQIRVHCASINHPVAGDTLYGPKKTLLASLKRHFLHASKLQVQLPGNIEVSAESPMPEDLQKSLAALREISNLDN